MSEEATPEPTAASEDSPAPPRLSDRIPATTAHALTRYRPDPSQKDRPWLLAIVDHPDTREMVASLEERLETRFRLAICPTVTAGIKLVEACAEAGDPVVAVLTEEPLAGMAGGGLWGLQKMRALAPGMIRLLGVQQADLLLRLAVDKLRDADVHQVFSLGITPDEFVTNILDPLMAGADDSIDESLRSATVRASSAAQLLRIPKQTFWELLMSDPRLSLGITRELSRRLRKQQQ